MAVGGEEEEFPALAAAPVRPPQLSAWSKKLVPAPSEGDTPNPAGGHLASPQSNAPAPPPTPAHVPGAPAAVALAAAPAVAPAPSVAPVNGLSEVPEGGLRSLIVDANAIIGGVNLGSFKAQRLLCTEEALAEVRDRNAQNSLSLMLTLADITCQEPSPSCLREGAAPQLLVRTPCGLRTSILGPKP